MDYLCTEPVYNMWKSPNCATEWIPIVTVSLLIAFLFVTLSFLLLHKSLQHFAVSRSGKRIKLGESLIPEDNYDSY